MNDEKILSDTTKAATYTLPGHIVDAIVAAQQKATARGDRRPQAQIVTDAIRRWMRKNTTPEQQRLSTPVVHGETRKVTYRLPHDVLTGLHDVSLEASLRGERLPRSWVVADAVRAYLRVRG